MSEKTMQGLVQSGYDRGDYAGVYRNRLTLNPFEQRLFERLTCGLRKGAEMLDVGSGPGVPYDFYLTERGISVTGIDISERHIEQARINVPDARYLLGDFLEHSLPSEWFDAVISLYTLFHLPRERHAEAVSKMAATLKPGGKILITVGTEDVPYKERSSFCGGRMAWSYFDTQTNLDILSGCGFVILEALNERDYGSDEKHVWILAAKNV